MKTLASTRHGASTYICICAYKNSSTYFEVLQDTVQTSYNLNDVRMSFTCDTRVVCILHACTVHVVFAGVFTHVCICD